MFADRCGFDVPVHTKEDADYGYFLNVNASPFELNESTGFSPGKSDFGNTDDNVPHENPIGDQFTAAVKDLMANNFSKEKFGTVSGIDLTKYHDKKGKRGTDVEFRCPLLLHNLEGSEGTIETEMSGKGSLSELHLGKCNSKVFERRTHLTRTDTFVVNESPDKLTGINAGVSGHENSARKTLLLADTYIVDNDGEVHGFDADSFGEAGRVSCDDDEVNQWETTDTGTECEDRSSYKKLDTAESTEEDIGKVDHSDSQNDPSGLQLPPSKDFLESPNVLASATATRTENDVGEQFMKEPNVRGSLIEIAGTEALFRGGDDKEAQIEGTSDCDDLTHASVMLEADKQESIVGSVAEGTGIVEDEQLVDSKGILASVKLFTDGNNELVDDTGLQKELKCDTSTKSNIILLGHESDTVINTRFCEADENKSEEIDAGIFRSVPEVSKEKETLYVTSGRAILGSGGYTFSKSDPEDDALQMDCVEGHTFTPDVNEELNEPQSATFLNSSTDDYVQDKTGTNLMETTEYEDRPRSGSDVVASTTLWEG